MFLKQISDDEDDTHPNIDTPSLFRWRHQARLERMERDQKEKEEVQKGIEEYELLFFSSVQALHMFWAVHSSGLF